MTGLPKHDYLLDALRGVALGFKPKKPRPEWAKKGIRRGASDKAWKFYEQHPLSWDDIRRIARRARLLCEARGFKDISPVELLEYDLVKAEPSYNEKQRMLILIEEAIYNLQEHLHPDQPGLARAMGDFMWAADWLSREPSPTTARLQNHPC